VLLYVPAGIGILVLLVHISLHYGAGEAQHTSHHVEDENGTRVEHLLVKVAGHALQQKVGVGSESKLRAVLPRLQSVAVDNVV